MSAPTMAFDPPSRLSCRSNFRQIYPDGANHCYDGSLRGLLAVFRAAPDSSGGCTYELVQRVS